MTRLPVYRLLTLLFLMEWRITGIIFVLHQLMPMQSFITAFCLAHERGLVR